MHVSGKVTQTYQRYLILDNVQVLETPIQRHLKI